MAFVFGSIMLLAIYGTCLEVSLGISSTHTAQVNAHGQVMRSARPGDQNFIQFNKTADAVEFEEWEFIFDATVNGRIKLKFVKDANTEWWGTEHMPVMVHGAKVAKAKGEPCVIVDVGAHRGATALVAAKLGCEVYAFEMDGSFFNGMLANMKLNQIPESQMHTFQMAVGDQVGHRIDENVPSTKKITVLKMDIDGPDVLAMHGASSLFSGAGVDFVNLEFSPMKHKTISHVTDNQYLDDMDALGFNVYLLDCYKRPYDVDAKISAAVGAHCLAFNRVSNDMLLQYEEPSNQKSLLQCVMEGKCDPKNKAADDAQHVPKEKFDAFVSVLWGNEVDLILTKKQKTILAPK